MKEIFLKLIGLKIITTLIFQKNENLSKDHPKRVFSFRESGYINSDDLEEQSDLNKIYESEEMLKFISDSLGVFPLYRWSDPLGYHAQRFTSPGTLMEMNLL